jgi:hypothetical protein
MGTGTSGRNTKEVKLAKCSICYKVPTPDCDWHQGRCPHLVAGIFYSRFYTLINTIKQLFKGNK